MRRNPEIKRRLRLTHLVAASLCVAAAIPASAPASPAHMWSHGADPAPGPAAKARASASAKLPATPSQTLPARWCGDQIGADDSADAVANGAFQYHALYLIPADGAVALDRIGDDIQRDAMDASALLERLYNRAIRFDMGTRCGPQNLDITTVRMPQTTAELRRLADSSDDEMFNAVRDAVEGAGFPLDNGDETDLPTNYVAWVDGPSPRGVCGQAELYSDERRVESNLNNRGGKVAAIYNAGTGQCRADVVRHEIGHTLGALQAAAPNAFDGAHCNDAYEDTMCEGVAPSRGNGARHEEYFDFGNDDYWSPPGGAPLGWWTLDLSRFLCFDASCNVAPGAAVTQVAVQPLVPAATPTHPGATPPKTPAKPGKTLATPAKQAAAQRRKAAAKRKKAAAKRKKAAAKRAALGSTPKTPAKGR